MAEMRIGRWARCQIMQGPGGKLLSGAQFGKQSPWLPPLDSLFVYFDYSQLPHLIFLPISAGSISRELKIQANTTVYITFTVLLKQMTPLK